MKITQLTLALFLSSIFLLFSHMAVAAYPASVVGTWSVTANHSVGNMNINSQGASGVCVAIEGDFLGYPMEGFYCPSTGRIHFLRKDPATDKTFQVYSGNVSWEGSQLYIAGTFGSFNTGLGEYSFFGQK